MNLFDVNAIFFTVLNYPMSYLEFVGTALNLAYVGLMVRRHASAWPIGILGAVWFGMVFYQIRLYADFIEQIYYVLACAYGWWKWSQPGEAVQEQFRFSSARALVGSGLATLGLAGILFLLIRRLPGLLPTFFPEAPELPALDSLTTAMSFAAMILVAHRRTENWIYWIFVNSIGVWLYDVKGVKLISGLYAIFLIASVFGLRNWVRAARNSNPRQTAAKTEID